jgi:predicted GTPase
VALLLVDAGDGLTEGDVAVGRLIDEKTARLRAGDQQVGSGRRTTRPPPSTTATARPKGMPFLSHSPIVFFSAKTGHHIEDLLAKLAATRDDYHRRFDDEELTAFFLEDRPRAPLQPRGARSWCSTARARWPTAPPTFVLRTSLEAGGHPFLLRAAAG